MKQAIAKGRKLITILSVLSILAVSIFSVFIGVDFTAVAETTPAPQVWAGYDADRMNLVSFTEGSGTATDPYMITNGDQLWYMIKGYGVIEGKYCSYITETNTFETKDGQVLTPGYYKLANDIYLNDISEYSKWGKKGFDMSALNNWHESKDIVNTIFYGKLDGDGHTIYGLYASGTDKTSFIATTGKDAVIKNLHFRNSYVINNSTYTPEDKDDSGNPINYEWTIKAKGCAAVVNAYCSAGDSNNNSVDITVTNCSVMDAYVESKYFSAGIFGYIDGAVPAIKNSIVADIKLNTTELGAKGGILNETWGAENIATMEGVICLGVPFYSTEYKDCWNGYKVPLASYKYLFKDCYSDVRHSFSIEHPTHGSLTFVDTEIKTVKVKSILGEAAKDALEIDWAHNWTTVDGSYPLPTKEYIVPTGPEYYANGGPKAPEDIWNGKAAKNFAAGTGTVDDPYLIENCEQFYRMVCTLNTDDYYKVADGVTALYFNEIKGMTYEQSVNYLANTERANLYNPGKNNFNGYFDGNGVTIYGVKAVNELLSGLFPVVNTCTLKNFTVKNSYIVAPDDNNSSTTVEGASAVIADMLLGASANLRNIAVIDCFVNSPTKTAGLVACSHTGGCVFIDDCIVAGGKILSDEGSNQTAAFVAGSNSGTHTIKNSISLDVYPAADNAQSYGSTFVNVYTAFDPPSSLVAEAASGVTQVAVDALKGEAVKATAPQFAWGTAWTTTADLPMPLKHTAVFGTPGKAWTGNISDAYLGGDGSKGNPYQIDTAERLAQMVAYCKPGAYYTLTQDIYVNDANSKNDWFTSNDVATFTGIFDGDGKTVHGVNYSNVVSGEYAGLVPELGSGGEVRNVVIADSKINTDTGSIVGAVVGTIADGASNAVSLRACQVKDTVVFTGFGTVGGIVGRVGYTKLKMDNCLFNGNLSGFDGSAAGLVATVIGKLELKESISAGTYPLLSPENIKFSAIYTDIMVPYNFDGVTVLQSSQMIGNNAKTYLTELDFVSKTATWAIVDGDYPVPTGATKSFDGVEGEVWSGETASNFAGGDGSVENPFLIATGEQLSLAISGDRVPNDTSDEPYYCNKNYKLIADIKLNDVYDSLWADRVGCQSWYSSIERPANFTGIFDGDGYVVYGMYYNNSSAPASTYAGLFPKIGGLVNIRNVGVSHAYINANQHEAESYAGGIFGMGSAFYDFYNSKTSPSETVNDEFKVPGEDTPTKLPVIERCFVDHNSTIIAGNAGGIGNPGGAVVVMRDCIVTATVEGRQTTRQGALIGNAWSGGQRLYDMLALPQNDVYSSAGSHQWIEDEASIMYYHEDVYYYGSKYIYGTTRITRPQWRVGEEAKTAMPGLDWENTWRVEPEGTPVLRVFDKPGRSGSLFSDKQFLIPDVKINFITGDSEISIDPIVGKPYEKVSLPTPIRTGYIFTGWYSFSDITLPYPYEYFLSRDINLYAGWEKNGIIQDFEDYLYSSYDCDLDRWNYNKPGSRGGYDFAYVHGGTKSMQLLNNSANSADLLLNYEEWLTEGQTYTMTFWVATNEANASIDLSLVHNNYPDYLGTEVASEPIITLTGLSVGEWKQYSFTFTAKTSWVSLRASGNSSLFVDDVIVSSTGDAVAASTDVTLNTINKSLSAAGGQDGTVSPDTADSLTVTVLITAIVACAIVAVISRKSFFEVIDNI